MGKDDGCQRGLIPALGDALLFNPAGFHAVTPHSGGRRIAFAFFPGPAATGRLVTWS